MTDDPTLSLLRHHLRLCVPFLIAEAKALSEDERLDRARAVMDEHPHFKGCFSEALLHRTPGETAREADRLVEAVALLAFCPGGVRIFGLLFCARHCRGGRRQEGERCGGCGVDGEETT